jgi:hypothetical protein
MVVFHKVLEKLDALFGFDFIHFDQILQHRVWAVRAVQKYTLSKEPLTSHICS